MNETVDTQYALVLTSSPVRQRGSATAGRSPSPDVTTAIVVARFSTAAIDEFSAHGYSGARVDAIAARQVQ